MGSSPGTSFRISDVEIFLYTASEGCARSVGASSGTPEQRAGANAPTKAASSAAQRLKRLLHWPKTGKSAKEKVKKVVVEQEEALPVPLRQRFSNAKSSLSSSSNNKRSLSVRSREASPAAKKKLAAGKIHGVMQGAAAGGSTRRSRSSSLSKLSFSSQSSVEASCSNEEGVNRWSSAVGNWRSSVMNQYLCFGGPTQGVETASEPYDLYERSMLAAA